MEYILQFVTAYSQEVINDITCKTHYEIESKVLDYENTKHLKQESYLFDKQY